MAFWLIANATIAAPPDIIFHHGKIVTVDGRFTIHEAVAVEAERVVQVGSNEAVLKTKGPNSQLIDLRGKMMLPGLIDSHVHPNTAAMTEWDHDIPDMHSIDDVLLYFAERAKETKEGSWIDLQQVFITRLTPQRYPTRAELDRVAPKHPVIFRTGPDASVNTMALKVAGIDRNFRIPEGAPGKIEKDEKGEPTGILRGYSNYLKIPAKEKKPDEEELNKRFTALFRDYNSVGLTTVADRAADMSAINRYEKLQQRGDLKTRIAASVRVENSASAGDFKAIGQHRLAKKENPMLQIIGVKTFLDGGMLTGSAYMRQPWGVSEIYSITDPEYRGSLFMPKERLKELVRAATDARLQFTAHSVGDGAVHTLLQVYEELSATLPLRETRPCLTHANFMSKEAVAAIAKLGVVVDIQPAWLYLDAHTLLKQFGSERLQYFQPLRSLFEAGAVIGGGSDHMQKVGSLRSINPYNPFLGMWIAITRKAKNLNNPFHPQEALSREQAIRFYTRNNAHLLFRERDIGSIETGKYADLVIVDRDLLTCPVDEIQNAQALETYLGGKLIFKR